MYSFQKIIIGLLGLVILSSCEKPYDIDEPLPDHLTASIFVVNNNNTVLAIDPETGDKKWETKIKNGAKATPIIYGGKLIVTDLGGILYQINRIDGKIEDEVPLGGPVSGTPVMIDDKMAIPIGNDVRLVDASNRFNFIWQYSATAPINTSLSQGKIPGNDTLQILFVSGDNVYALNFETGIVTWKKAIAGAGTFNSSALVVDEKFIYAGNDNGKLYSFNIKDGSINWAYQTGAEIYSSPISVGGNILVGSNDRYLYSVDSATGNLRWKSQVGDRVMSSPFVYDQEVFFGSNDKNLYSVNIIDGTLKWKKLTFGTVIGSPMAYKNIVYFTSHDNNLYALNTKTGAQKWVINTGGYITSSPIFDDLDVVISPATSRIK
ncbi:MAG TPA: PQQ-binding-like beta-propeller repeat protein [Edaphocola sp.]|nr:PQQ-binding-like beta-propeller repeat protein [Edaphocola sp.]